MKQIILACALISLLPASRLTSAAITVYTDEAEFLSAMNGAAYLLEDFDSYTYGSFVGPSLDLGPENGYSATLTAPNFLYSGDGNMSTNSAIESILATLTGSATYAVGGWFFASDIFGVYTTGTVILTLSDGTTETFETYDPENNMTFRGFISDVPLKSIAIDAPDDPNAPKWPTMDHFYVGGVLDSITTAADPVQGGTVTCDPNPVTRGSDSSCTATPNPGYRFSSWSGGCSGDTCELENVTEPMSVMAQFTQIGGAEPVPAVGPWGLSLLTGLLAGLGGFHLRSRRRNLRQPPQNIH